MQKPKEEFPRQRLLAWLGRLGYTAVGLVDLVGDVSPRSYLRVELQNGGSAMLTCYPEAVRAACRRFAKTTARLEAAGVPVPALLAVDCDAGLMLVADAGGPTLYDRSRAGWRDLYPYYEKAVDIALRIAAIPALEVGELSPPLGEALLRRELQETWDLFLLPRGLAGRGRLSERLRCGLDELCAHLGGEPPIPCHRDFMARNLVPQEPPPGLVVLDHQDLRLGPPHYDLASLFNDSLFPPRWVEDRLLWPLLDSVEAHLCYHRAAAQRTLKALGTFEAFSQRGFDRHLQLVPPTWRRARHHLARLPETEAVSAELKSLWASPVDSAPNRDLLE